MRLLVPMVVLLLIGGCLGGGQDDATDDPETTRSGEPDGQAPPRPVAAEAPDWQVGDWWRWEVSGRGFESFELTTVVGRSLEDGYVVGSPDLPESLRAHILHVPPQGPVAMPGFGWYIHGDDVAIVDFPLHDGKTWSGSLEGNALDFSATVEERDGRHVFLVDSTYEEFGGQGPRYVYDPAIGMFAELHIHYGGSTPFSSAAVVDSGTDYEGDLRLPWARDKFLEGVGGPAPGSAPRGTFTSQMEKEWLVFACYLGGDAGAYGITFVTPSANEDPLRCSFQNDQAGFGSDVQVMWRSSVPGEWNVLFDVVGDGFATAEVIGVVEERCHLGPGPSDLDACD